jgi:peptidyl-prolyl cis-trans isomerase B (cyclophilin B)
MRMSFMGRRLSAVAQRWQPISRLSTGWKMMIENSRNVPRTQQDAAISPRDMRGVRANARAMKLPLFSLLAALAVASSVQAADDKKEVAVIKTSAGEMVVEFWSDVAPKTVENFKKLANEKFYDGTAFHRIIKGFMIQGGDPQTKDPSKEARWGTGDPGYKIKAEFNPKKHVRGVLSMARSSDPDSAGCQFFICLDPTPQLDGKYTGFGKVIKGEDVLLKLGDTKVGPSPSGEPSKPLERVGVESIRIVPADSIK